MAGSIGSSSGMAAAALALLLLFRLLIPAGYMISADRDGAPALVLCAPLSQPAAREEAHGGHDGHPAGQAPAGSAERPCVFAALGAPPLLPAPPALLPRAPAAHLAPDPPPAPAFPRPASAAATPPATGPPLPV